MKVNGYQRSVAKYLRSLDLKLNEDSLVLDAGSGTGIITLGFHDSGLPFGRVVDLDLSFKSIEVSREELEKKSRIDRTDAVQANVLAMPFADETFDLVLTCGVLEYTPLDDGLREAARVLKKGAPLVFVPVKPSIVGSVLELLYNFKIHPLESVRTAAQKYFRILGNHEFPITEPIGWSKTVFLLEKI
jgi:demethylmenaquinone methyltransferase/2-methoxy-6-polyprenyl-1,4-benzoquinol methylase